VTTIYPPDPDDYGSEEGYIVDAQADAESHDAVIDSIVANLAYWPTDVALAAQCDERSYSSYMDAVWG